MPTDDVNQVIGLALSNPRFRNQLLDPHVNNATLLQAYGLPVTPATLQLDHAQLTDSIRDGLGAASWCIGNACGGGA